MTNKLHWLPIEAHIQYKILHLVSKAYHGQAPKYLCDLIRKPDSALSLSVRSLRSSDRFDLFIPRTRTAIAQRRAFATMGPYLWNSLPHKFGLGFWQVVYTLLSVA